MLALPLALLLQPLAGASPTPVEMAKALASFTRKPISAQDLRRIACRSNAEEPTEAECKWKWWQKGLWRRYATSVALDGHGWQLIDAPAPIK